MISNTMIDNNVELSQPIQQLDFMKETLNVEIEGYSSDSAHSTSSSSDAAATWSGFLMERFPDYGTKEFKWLKQVAWPRYGLNKERIYNHKPQAPDWFQRLKKEFQQELMYEIVMEQTKILEKRKNEYSMEEPHLNRETIVRLINLVLSRRKHTSSPTLATSSTPKISMSDAAGHEVLFELSGSPDKPTPSKTLKYCDMKELTKYFWEKKWLLFKESCYPRLWADVVGDKEYAICIYLNGIDDGDKLNGTWGLVLNKALEFERSFENREDNWRDMRRYQNLDGSQIRPVMTVYREMRDVLEQEEAELMDVFFGTLPLSAFPELDPEIGFYRQQKTKSNAKKRPLTISMNVVMLSDISTVHQRFSCMFQMQYSWKQTINGGRYYYIKEQLDELDEMSTNKEKVFKAEWKPPEPILKNAIASKLIKETPPHIRCGEYNTLYSNITYRATFSEKMELENFPFDCQELNMSMEIKGNDFDLKGKNEQFITIDWDLFALDEWQPSKNAVDCKIERSGSRATSNDVVITFKLQRDPSNYVYKLAITSFMIVTGTFMFFGIANDDIADRLNYIATMFLTGQAFQMVATNETPSLGYLSMIDYFLVIGNLFIYIQFVVAIFINFESSRSHANDPVNLSCLAISAGLYAAFTIGWIIWARVVSIPKEATKLNATQLDLYSEGFIYILTYFDVADGSGDDHLYVVPPSRESISPIVTEEIVFSRESVHGKLAALNKKTLKITEIVGKRIDDDASIFQILSGTNLLDTIEGKKSQIGDIMQHPIWKSKDMNRIKAKKLKLRNQRTSLRNHRKSRKSKKLSRRESGKETYGMELKKPATVF